MAGTWKRRGEQVKRTSTMAERIPQGSVDRGGLTRHTTVQHMKPGVPVSHTGAAGSGVGQPGAPAGVGQSGPIAPPPRPGGVQQPPSGSAPSGNIQQWLAKHQNTVQGLLQGNITAEGLQGLLENVDDQRVQQVCNEVINNISSGAGALAGMQSQAPAIGGAPSSPQGTATVKPPAPPGGLPSKSDWSDEDLKDIYPDYPDDEMENAVPVRRF